MKRWIPALLSAVAGLFSRGPKRTTIEVPLADKPSRGHAGPSKRALRRARRLRILGSFTRAVLGHVTMTPDPKKVARNARRRARKAALGYRLWGRPDTAKFMARVREGLS